VRNENQKLTIEFNMNYKYAEIKFVCFLFYKARKSRNSGAGAKCWKLRMPAEKN